jgi:YggT family protein
MSALIRIISLAIGAYQFLIFIRVLLSWINTDPYRRRIDHPLVRLLYQITDPVLRPLQRIIPPLGGTVDISPVIALFILEGIRWLLISLLSSF